MDTSGFSILDGYKAARPRKGPWLPNGEMPEQEWTERSVIDDINDMWADNAHTIVSRTARLMKQAWTAQGLPSADIEARLAAYKKDALSSDYEHVRTVSHRLLTEEAHLELDPLDEPTLAGSEYVEPKGARGRIEDFYGENAMLIIARVSKTLLQVERLKNPKSGGASALPLVEQYREQAQAGDYEHLVNVSRHFLYKYCGIVSAPMHSDEPMCRDCGGGLPKPTDMYCPYCLE
jgi:hypothetical protein